MNHPHGHTRRDFFTRSFGGTLVGATVLEEAFFRASWARAQAAVASATLLTSRKWLTRIYARSPAAIVRAVAEPHAYRALGWPRSIPPPWRPEIVFDSQGNGALILGVSVALPVGDTAYVGAFQGERLLKFGWKQ